jgi:hypothetical protein
MYFIAEKYFYSLMRMKLIVTIAEAVVTKRNVTIAEAVVTKRNSMYPLYFGNISLVPLGVDLVNNIQTVTLVVFSFQKITVS